MPSKREGGGNKAVNQNSISSSDIQLSLVSMAGERKSASGPVQRGSQSKGQAHGSEDQGRHRSDSHELRSHDHNKRSDKTKSSKEPSQRKIVISKSQTKMDKRSTRENISSEGPQVTQSLSGFSLDDDEVIFQNGDEKVFNSQSGIEADDNQNRGNADDMETGNETTSQEEAVTEFFPVQKDEPIRLTQDKYDIKSFNSSINEFVNVLSASRFQVVKDNYPMEDLLSVISVVSATIDEYKQHAVQTQQHLEQLRVIMQTVKENIHMSITHQAYDRRREDGSESVEEMEARAKVLQLNTVVASAHGEVAQANKLTAETEFAATQAHLLAEQARNEAQRIREEVARKAEADKRRKEEEERKRKEEEHRILEEKKKQEEEKAKELIRRRRSSVAKVTLTSRSSFIEHLPIYQYDTKVQEEIEVLCLVRASSDWLDKSDIVVTIINQLDINVTYGLNEELISRIIHLTKEGGRKKITGTFYILIPHNISRSAAVSREPVIKALSEGKWVELPTCEITFDHLKDMKFAQAETEHFTTFVVMSRLKHDYATLTHRPMKIISSYDPRIVVSIVKDTFENKDQFVLQVQPVESSIINDFRSRDPRGKGLITSSPIVYMQLEAVKFAHPINITLPCPPNPAKAQKLAQVRKTKEDKLPGSTEQKGKKAQPTADSASEKETVEGTRPQSRWYMGQYGQTDDDENDNLYFIGFHVGKWQHISSVKITETKLDILSVDVDSPVERFIVIRVRTTVEVSELNSMAIGLNEYLVRRNIQVIARQRTTDHYEVCIEVVPAARFEKAIQRLNDEGFGTGPSPSGVRNCMEGDEIVVSFRGNIRHENASIKEVRIIYNSNSPTGTTFLLAEVDRYLQKNFNAFRGMLHIIRRYKVLIAQKSRRPEDHAPDYDLREEVLADMVMSIPKYHIEPLTLPARVPVVISNPVGSVNGDVLFHVAHELGEEWRQLAAKLSVDRVRLQAILRTTQGTGGETSAKYEMLMTWLKRTPRAADKHSILSEALSSIGRQDLIDLLSDDSQGGFHSSGHI